MITALVTIAWPVSANHTMVMASQGMLLAGFIVLVLWVWRETNGDERDRMHRMVVGRYAYLIGSGVLVCGVVVQSLDGAVDPWLAWALTVMVVTKVFGNVYARLHA